MLDTIGLLHLTPTRALMAIIGVNNGVEIDDDALEISNIRSLGDRLTKVDLQVRKHRNLHSNLPLVGTTEFTYNRLDIGTFFNGVNIDITLNLPTNTNTLVSVLSNYYGYVFDNTDFVIELIDSTNAHQYRLKASPRSIRWVGELTIDLIKRIDLSTLTTNTDIGSLVNPPETFRPTIQYHKQITDCLFYGSELIGYKEGVTPDLEGLRRCLTRAYYNAGVGEAITWVNSPTPAAHNVAGIEVIYNGRANVLGVKPYYIQNHRIVILRLSPILCTDVVGDLVLYYNSRLGRVVPDTPLHRRYPAELLKPQAISYLQSSSILLYPKDYQFLINNTDVAFLDQIYDRVGLPANQRWCCSPTPSDWNLYGATVRYSGFNQNYPEAYNTKFQQIWVVELNPNYCNNLVGELQVHYNLRHIG